MPIDQLLMRPQLIPKKHFTNKAIATQLERAIKVASARCGGLDMDVNHDAQKFVACLMWVILERHRSAVAPMHARTPCAEVVKEYVDRFFRGEFEALFAINLPVVTQQPHPDPNCAPHAAAHLLAVA